MEVHPVARPPRRLPACRGVSSSSPLRGANRSSPTRSKDVMRVSLGMLFILGRRCRRRRVLCYPEVSCEVREMGGTERYVAVYVTQSLRPPLAYDGIHSACSRKGRWKPSKERNMNDGEEWFHYLVWGDLITCLSLQPYYKTALSLKNMKVKGVEDITQRSSW